MNYYKVYLEISLVLEYLSTLETVMTDRLAGLQFHLKSKLHIFKLVHWYLRRLSSPWHQRVPDPPPAASERRC